MLKKLMSTFGALLICGSAGASVVSCDADKFSKFDLSTIDFAGSQVWSQTINLIVNDKKLDVGQAESILDAYVGTAIGQTKSITNQSEISQIQSEIALTDFTDRSNKTVDKNAPIKLGDHFIFAFKASDNSKVIEGTSAKLQLNSTFDISGLKLSSSGDYALDMKGVADLDAMKLKLLSAFREFNKGKLPDAVKTDDFSVKEMFNGNAKLIDEKNFSQLKNGEKITISLTNADNDKTWHDDKWVSGTTDKLSVLLKK